MPSNHHPDQDIEYFQIPQNTVPDSFAVCPNPLYASGSCCSDLYHYSLLLLVLELLKWNNTVYTLLWLESFAWYSIFYISPLVACISSSLCCWEVFHCVAILQFVFPFTFWWTFGSFLIFLLLWIKLLGTFCKSFVDVFPFLLISL